MTEKFNVHGPERQNKRRDLRRGRTLGSVTMEGGAFVMRCRWEDPLAGEGTDVLRLVDDNTLTVESSVRMPAHGREFGWRETWRR